MTCVDSHLPRDYRLICKLFTPEKLDEQYRRHTLGAESGCKAAAACLREVRRELLRRQQPGYKPYGGRQLTDDELFLKLFRERRAERRATRRRS